MAWFLENQASEHRHPYAAHAVVLSRWAYEPMMPGQSNALVIDNNSGRPYNITVTETGEVIRIEPFTLAKINSPVQQVTLRMVGEGGGRDATRPCNIVAQTGHRFNLVCGDKGQPYLLPNSGLPNGFKCESVQLSEGKSIACWSVFTSGDTIWIVFRGTKSLVDVLVDVCLVTYDDADHGLSVQGGMWLSLTQSKHHTLDMINAEIDRLRVHRPYLTKVVISGHSLGGGYAILAGLYRIYRNLPVTSVVAFGAPQCIVPDRSNRIWQALNAVTTVYVNSWDLVPRLPSCLDWLFDVLPGSLPERLALKVGTLAVGVKAGGGILQQFYPHRDIFADYGVVGTLNFIRAGSRKVVSLSHLDDNRRNILSMKPPRYGGYILDQHSVFQYYSIVLLLG